MFTKVHYPNKKSAKMNPWVYINQNIVGECWVAPWGIPHPAVQRSSGSESEKYRYSKDNGMSHLRLGYRETVISVLLAHSSSLLFACSEGSLLPCCELPVERFMGQGTEGGLWPTWSEELKSSGQQPTRNWILPTTHEWACYQMRQQPRWHLDWGLVRDLEAEVLC